MSLFCLCIGQEPYDLKFGIVNNETITENQNGSLLYINRLDNKTFNKVFFYYMFLCISYLKFKLLNNIAIC